MHLYELQLLEGLISSIDRDKLKSILQRKIPNIKFMNWPGYEHLLLSIIDKPDHAALQKILPSIGWYESKVESHRLDRTILMCRLEPKYDAIIDVPDTLWHVTPQAHVNKILKIGLSPRTQSKETYHPERVYLALSRDSAVYLANRFSKGDGFENGGNKKSYSLLEIDTRSIPKIKFHNDVNFINEGVYTTQNIPPAAVSLNMWHI